MSYLYSLYDALVSINVPGDKARAVIDALERDMGTTLATKADLEVLDQKFEQRTELVRQDLQQRTDLLRKDMQQATELVRKDAQQATELVRKDMQQATELLRKDIEILGTSLTVRLGSIVVVGLGILFTALKLTA